MQRLWSIGNILCKLITDPSQSVITKQTRHADIINFIHNSELFLIYYLAYASKQSRRGIEEGTWTPPLPLPLCFHTWMKKNDCCSRDLDPVNNNRSLASIPWKSSPDKKKIERTSSYSLRGFEYFHRLLSIVSRWWLSLCLTRRCKLILCFTLLPNQNIWTVKYYIIAQSDNRHLCSTHNV